MSICEEKVVLYGLFIEKIDLDIEKCIGKISEFYEVIGLKIEQVKLYF